MGIYLTADIPQILHTRVTIACERVLSLRRIVRIHEGVEHIQLAGPPLDGPHQPSSYMHNCDVICRQVPGHWKLRDNQCASPVRES